MINNIPVNENIDSYKNTVIMGLTLTQTVSLLAAVLLGSIEFLLIHFLLHLDYMFCSLIILPTAGVVVMGMNYEKDGLNLIETIRYGRYKKNAEVLCYESTESILNYVAVDDSRMLSIEEQAEKQDIDAERLSKYLIVVMMIGLLAIAAAAIGFVIWMG